METSGNFTFHSVGQGLFYSGTINIDGTERHIVYDCGTFFEKGLLQHEINETFSCEDTIDLLVISHMDQDHISGIRYLLDRVSRVKVLFMPYTEPEELAFYAVKYESSRRKHTDYINLILDFEDVVSNEKIQRVIMLTDQEGDGNPVASEGTESEDISFKFRGNREKQESIDKVLQEKKIQVAYYDGICVFSMAWDFRFYVQDHGREDRVRFHESLEKRELTISSFRDLRGLWESKEQLAKLKEAYEEVHKKLNLTSLMLLHKPLGHDEFFITVYPIGCCRVWRHFPRCCIWRERGETSLTGTTILLGDAMLRSKKSCEAIKTYFSNDLGDCAIALVPHHGSKDNGCQRLLQYIESELWVVSFGIHGRYGHPDTEVLRDFGKSWEYVHDCAGREQKTFPCLWFCNEYQSVRYEITTDKEWDILGRGL